MARPRSSTPRPTLPGLWLQPEGQAGLQSGDAALPLRGLRPALSARRGVPPARSGGQGAGLADVCQREQPEGHRADVGTQRPGGAGVGQKGAPGPEPTVGAEPAAHRGERGALPAAVRKLPEAGQYRSDAYGVYRAWLPLDQHAVGRGRAVDRNEGLHSVWRGRLNRLMRRTKGYTKSVAMPAYSLALVCRRGRCKVNSALR